MVGTCHLQGRQPLPWGRSSVSFGQISLGVVFQGNIWPFYSGQRCFKGVLGMDLLSSENVALTMGHVPYEFQADWLNFIFQSAAPEMIWHIYSGQCCLTWDGAIHLLSSGEMLLGLGKVPCKSPGQCNIPEDSRSITSTQPTVNVPNHVRSRWLKNEGCPISSKVTGDLPHHEGTIP